MGKNAHTSRWRHRALNLTLLALGVVAMALLYALVSQHVGFPKSQPPASQASSNREAAAKAAPPAGDSPRGDSPRDDSPTGSARAGDVIQVGVRNGCGEAGLAARARGYLVRAGFDVVKVGNYSSFDLDSSMVIDRVGNRAAARRVARALGIPKRRVRQDLDAGYYLDASVVLGGDYRTLKPFRGDAQTAAAR